MDLTLLFAGAVVSVVIQIIKKYAGTQRIWTLSILVVLAILCSWGASYLKVAGLWDSFLQIMSGAGILYAFFIKNLEDKIEGEK